MKTCRSLYCIVVVLLCLLEFQMSFTDESVVGYKKIHVDNSNKNYLVMLIHFPKKYIYGGLQGRLV